MDTKRDIETREDIRMFLEDFYEDVKIDPDIGVIFTEIVPMDWDHHIPLITNFWETILLDNPVYRGNAMEPHFRINNKYPLKEIHFNAWLRLFNRALDKHFEGPRTELARKRAHSIAGLMLFRMPQSSAHGPEKI